MISNKTAEKLYELYPVLSELTRKHLDVVLANAKLTDLKADTQLFDELNACNAFPFVLAGNIRVFKRSQTGREITLYNVTAGDACVVTAACLLGNKPYKASGIVQSDCELVMMSSDDFESLLGIRVFREFFFSLFCKRVLDLMQLVDEVAFHKLDQRLATLLLRSGRDMRISHQALADELGTVREMVTKLLNSFADTGLVNLSREHIVIRDESGLKKLCES